MINHMKKVLLSTLLAVGLTGVAHAQVPGDLILGFATSATSEEFDLGQVSSLPTGGTFLITNLNSSNYGANEIATIFGSGWNTSAAGVSWGLAASTPSPATTPEIWGGAVANSSPLNGISSTSPYGDPSSRGVGTPAGDIAGIYNFWGTQPGTTTTGSPTATHVSSSTADTNSGAWQFQEGGPSRTNDFGFFALNTFDNTTDTADNNGWVAEDLYAMPDLGGSNVGTYLGTIEILSNGNVNFITIPEPSVYAAILGGACLALVAIRRRKQQILA
jgi:hypothetical protein